MNLQKQRLLIEQVDKKLFLFKSVENVSPPQRGWVYAIRTALKMSLRQLAARLKMSAQSVDELEKREANGSITIKTLREVAKAFDLKLVYGFVPKGESIESMIEKRANEKAREIVLRTSNTMKLEDQENSQERIDKAIKSKAEEIKNKMPKYLWD
ncbi:MAG: mobile mystery protein A [Bacteroidota bacterium]